MAPLCRHPTCTITESLLPNQGSSLCILDAPHPLWCICCPWQLNVCPLIPCSIGHKDFSMLFLFHSRLSLKHLSPKLFLPPQCVAFSKGIASPSTSVLCPWVTSPADVYVIITSIQLPLKYLSTIDLPRIGFASHCLRSATSWQTACYQTPWDPKKELIKKQTQQHSFP